MTSVYCLPQYIEPDQAIADQSAYAARVRQSGGQKIQTKVKKETGLSG